MDQVARELLRAIRGRRSQEAFSRRLGYTSNPVAGWEAGRRFPTAAETLRACGLSGIDVAAAFARFHGPAAAQLGGLDDAGVAAWLRALAGHTPIREIAERAGYSRFRVSRWLNDQTRPRLPAFLTLIEAFTGRLTDLVAELVPIAQVPSLLTEHTRKEISRRLAVELPWTEAVLRLLETSDYQALPGHKPGWIGQRLGISPAAEAECLQRLEAAGVVSWTGMRYQVDRPLTVDTPSNAETLVLRTHWAQVGLERLPAFREGDMFGYNVLSVSRDDYQRVRALTRGYFDDLRALVAGSTPEEVAALVLIQLVGFDDRPLKHPPQHPDSA